jgi:hypothetical protein
MSMETSWTHGNSLVVEDPGEYVNIRHRGWGTELYYYPVAWPSDSDQPGSRLSICHIPIPTPGVVNGETALLARVYYLFRTQGPISLISIDVWDGINVVYSRNLLEDQLHGKALTKGDFLESVDFYNQTTIPGSYHVQTGINLSLSVEVDAVDPNNPDPDAPMLSISAAGADFAFPSSPLTFHTGYATPAIPLAFAPKRFGK